MNRIILFGMLLLSFSTGVFAEEEEIIPPPSYIWSGTVPTEIHIVPNGMILLGAFHDTSITCATGENAVQAIYVPKTASNFEMKLSISLTAKATKKEIKVLIDKPSAAECIQISAMGYVPIAYDYYFQLRN